MNITPVLASNEAIKIEEAPKPTSKYKKIAAAAIGLGCIYVVTSIALRVCCITPVDQAA